MSTSKLIGKKVANYADRDRSSVCYFFEHERWFIFLPEAGLVGDGWLGDLSNHTIEEHEDGTISVTPSIKISDSNSSRHGYLTRGDWTEC